ncbi:TnsD family Tn7-like transposition protein [Pseudomonas sp. GCM10022186]|uniref:TnsD family Tn7-like transposition protein n=1 Tax=Pseudomonas sp. GCM10022186 TaxID=3252650 RepID=UPI003605C036
MNTSCVSDDSFFLHWLCDETFFSLCSRYHSFVGNLLASTTCETLFNTTEYGTKHDFPCNLMAFEKNTATRYGSADSIIQNHTILPFFAPFQSRETMKKAVSAMKGSELGSTKYQLGLIAGRFGAEHPLKACSECMANDIATQGVAYWHLKHQYPGVVLCPIHRRLLQECHQKRRWAGRFSWTLPCEEVLDRPCPIEIDSPQRDALLQLADGVIRLASVGFSRTFQRRLVRQVYKHELRKPAPLRQARWDPANPAASFLEYSALLRPFRPLNSLPASQGASRSFIHSLLRSPRGYCHPLRHVVMITWLFGDFSNFLKAYNDAESQEQAGERQGNPHGHLHIPLVSTQMAACAEPPTPGRRRPKVLKANVRSMILQRLAAGATKSEICAGFDITVSTINKLLRAEPDIKAAWTESRDRQVLLQHRTAWAALIDQSPHDCAKALRARAPDIYAWLYRHDRAWLFAQTASLPTGRRGNHSSVDWSARDRDLENLVRASLIATYGTDQGISLTRPQLYSLIPCLPTCLEKRSRYPQTRSFLHEIEAKASSSK